jgi:hypothetical protein
MGKRVKIFIIAASVAIILALSIGVVAAAAGPNNANNNGNQCGQQAGSGQGVCSEAISDLLGLTTSEIQAMRLEGKSLVQIAATKGVTEQKLVEAVVAERKASIQERVNAGTLTQEQANIMLQQMEENVIRAINRTTVGKPEWAGISGAGQDCNGQQGTQMSAVGSGNGEPGLCTGPGNAHKWGKASQ